jgi:hypothetical protein
MGGGIDNFFWQGKRGSQRTITNLLYDYQCVRISACL